MEPKRPHVRSKRVFRSCPEPELFPLDIESKLLPGDIARKIKAGMQAMDPSSLRSLYEDRGGIAYDPVSMLGIVLLAWSKGVRSSREIEDRCRTDIRFMWISGGIEPDYRSVLRFLNRLAPAMDGIQKRFVEACCELGFLEPRRIALDGTKIGSAASQLRNWMESEDAPELEELGFEVPGCSDPEARIVRGAGGKVLGYNAQAALDADTGLVLASEVFQASADRGLLGPMAEKLASQHGELVQGAEIVADKGYDSHEGLQRCADLGFEACVPPQDGTALFWTAVSDAEIVCPMGKSPEKVQEVPSHGKPCGVWRVRACSRCPLVQYCTEGRRRRGRSLVVPLGCDPVLRVLQAHRVRSPEGKEAMSERMGCVEPFFGWIKWVLKADRFLRRGLAGARLELGLLALARNAMVLGGALEAFFRAFLSFANAFQAALHAIPRSRPESERFALAA